ncbi:MAG: S-methyl-5-thioribose-1-phosphate isomerase [Betaproteobacteria bacterium]|nr:S-methyl-5-thioribose-1-phosphate isomerase [Betaproteobacteria bacterium]
MKVNGQHHRAITGDPATGEVRYIDQTRLPHEFAIKTARNMPELAEAIRAMAVRGAPLIGVTAAFGIALALGEDASDAALDSARSTLLATRPTAVNLAWALKRICEYSQRFPEAERAAAAWAEAQRIADEDVAINHAIGRHTLPLIQELAEGKHGAPVNILTHCNAGWIATVDWGTALSGLYQAHDANIRIHVWVDETRPRKQGLLTAWELRQHGVPHTVIADNAGGHLMQHGRVDMVIVGADRVTGQGDVCNKIGTYLKALAAYDNRVPFYAAVPSPTIDLSIGDALREIEIEERSADELRHVRGLDSSGRPTSIQILPDVSPAANPGFDVTPARLVTGIITEKGIAAPRELARLLQV